MNDKIVNDYPFLIRPLTKEEGGGYLIEFPDLPGCISDGDTYEEAIRNGDDAKKCWILAAKEAGRKVPPPTVQSDKFEQSGKWVQRAPKSIHARLVSQAKDENVSLNMLVVSMISEGLGKRETRRIPHSPLEKNRKSNEQLKVESSKNLTEKELNEVLRRPSRMRAMNSRAKIGLSKSKFKKHGKSGPHQKKRQSH